MKTLTTFLCSAMFMLSGIAQQKTISGVVSDSSGLPLPGVNIFIKGSATGTQTDFDGEYEIMASVGDVLVFTYVGLKTQEVTVGTSAKINVVLEEDKGLVR